MSDYFQANLDGTIERAAQPPLLSKIHKIQILEDSFKIFNHKVIWVDKDSQPAKAKVVIDGIEEEIAIDNKTVVGGGRVDTIATEQRVQIRGEKLNELVDINLAGGKAIILGIYNRHNTPIIVAWKPMIRQNGGNVSKQININVIAIAMRDGFSQFLFSSGNGGIVCAFRIEFMYFYLSNMEKLSESLIKDFPIGTCITPPRVAAVSLPLGLQVAHNRIVFGAPGTGKSYRLEEDRNNLFKHNYERVTFHPNYSYASFVGTYKPKPKLDSTGVEYISYEFVPGPFLRIWIKSMRYPEIQLLIIEEINRANVAAVFGDVFQMLDRKNGDSEYAITTSEDMRKYLIDVEHFNEYEVETIRIPSNMYIWATMNSADQGVFPIDTAFKRRWSFEYIGINENESENDKDITLSDGKVIAWNVLRHEINYQLVNVMKLNEDKMVGPFFLSDDDLTNNFNNAFKSKLLMYLYMDVINPHRRDEFFIKDMYTYSKLLETYKNHGGDIFCFKKDYKSIPALGSNVQTGTLTSTLPSNTTSPLTGDDTVDNNSENNSDTVTNSEE